MVHLPTAAKQQGTKEAALKEQAKRSPEGIVRTTIRVPRSLWDAVRHRAIDEGSDAQELVIRALQQYLKQKGGRP